METEDRSSREERTTADEAALPQKALADLVSGATDSALSSPSWPAAGIIDFKGLKAIQETLLESREKDDVKLAGWIENNYLGVHQDPQLEGGPIATTAQYAQLLAAYNRVQNLTQKTQPENWPFYTPNWKPLAKTKVKLFAAGLADVGTVTLNGEPKIKGSDVTESKAKDADIRDAHETPTQNGGDGANTDLPTVTANKDNEPMAVLSSSPSAVYSEPVKTNLDRLPPSSYRTNLKGAPKNTQNSRKSSTMRGGTRGRRGRPRGGLSRADAMVDRNTQQESAKDVASDMSEPSAPEPSRTDMAAPRRKSTRARGEGPASRLSTTEDNSLPSKPNGDGTRKRNVRDLNGSPGESASNGASKVPGGQNEPRKRIKLSQQKPAKKGPKTKSNGIRTENGESNALKSINEASTPTRVEYFARVQNSSNASVEIPIPATFLAVDATLVERYIEYKAEEEEGLNLSLEQFVKISEFANRK